MASTEGIGSTLLKQPSARFPKLRIYESLFLLNEGVDHVITFLRSMERLPFCDEESARCAMVEIEEVRCDMNADFTQHLANSERFDEGRFWKQRRVYEKKWRDPMTCISTSNAVRKNARSRDCRPVSALSLTPQSPVKNNAGKHSKSGRNSAPGSAGSNSGGTIMTRIHAKERREIEKRSKQREERLRGKYPEVHGKVVDFITHTIDDGMLYFTVRFEGKTSFFSLRLRYVHRWS